MALRWQTTLVLVVVVKLYATIGGFIFHYLEVDNEKRIQREINENISEFLADNSCLNETDLATLTRLMRLMDTGGIRLQNGSLTNTTRWDFATSVFVAIELTATVGYKSASPKSSGGRAFALIFAFVTLPICFIAALGFAGLINLAAEALFQAIARCWLRLRHGVASADEVTSDAGYAVFGRKRHHTYRTLFITIVGIVLLVLIPGIIFERIEGWTYAEALYYCFISLVTIGFGDFVPGYGNPPSWLPVGIYRLAVGCWILILLGWAAGVLTSFKHFIADLAERAEIKASDTVADVFHTTPAPPHLVVNSTGGETSQVDVIPPEKKKSKKQKVGRAIGDVTVLNVASQPTYTVNS